MSAVEEFDNCKCSCCEEARNLRKAGRIFLQYACTCYLYKESERCDCAFCKSMTPMLAREAARRSCLFC